ncbi:MarR family winged helix-turn-helix transcriptional regulator [Nocardioides sp.]|uniref:MarR family winged helix-turn-helix transcriptional regulator n=1 Tax=Nocardioides sp. TaxID=35761 RepID=UPI003D0E8A42
MSDEVHDLSGELVVYAARLVRAVRRLSDSPGAAIRVISLLDEHGPLGVGELARIDRCSQPTMSGAVNSLVQRGWVAKTPDPDDARATRVTMTEAGRTELSRVRSLNADAVAARFATLPDHDVRDLATAVAVLRDLLPHPTEGSL